MDYSGNSSNANNVTLQNVINQKTNSRGYNRSQVPPSLQPQNNNIGIIQNFNSYHIELKNVTKDGGIISEDGNSLERIVEQQAKQGVVS